jgi:hypothetical protein
MRHTAQNSPWNLEVLVPAEAARAALVINLFS